MFKSSFQPSFQNPFPKEGAAVDWWLSGDISADDCVAAYQAKGAASLAASYSNLNNPGTNDAAPGVAPTWDTINGWVFASVSSQYLLTGIVLANDDCSVVIRYANTISVNGYLCSAFSGGIRTLNILPLFGGSTILYANGSGGVTTVAPVLSGGVLSISKYACYRNAILDGTISTGSGNVSSTQFTIGAFNNSGSLGSFLGGNIQSISVYDIVLSAPQVLAVTNAMNLL